MDDILNKSIFISWINKGETCVFTRKIPRYIYPFAENRHIVTKSNSDNLKVYIDKYQVYETLNDNFHRNITGAEAEKWREWAKNISKKYK